ncbi:MAG: hypothetical protein EPO26_10255 [Chloroflexota bacterium]|nr:MAG: hypothetical protein EPO26_10255 [Chloroflexota bacterium]
MGIVGSASMGPGSPAPVQYNYRAPQVGKPSIAYNANANQVSTTVGLGKDGSFLAASFEPRPPVRPSGVNIGAQRGTFVDTNA